MNIADEINKSAGKKIAFFGKDSTGQDIEVVKTGILPLDGALMCGGLPKGRIIEVHGLHSTGKTSLCLAFIASFQKQGLDCAYVDAEYSFNFDHAKTYGVDTDKLILVQPDCGEEAFSAMEKLVNDGTKLIIVDSVSALMPKPEAEADFGTAQIGGQARLMASGLRKLVPVTSKKGSIIVFINQLRVNIMGGQYDPYTLPGGQSLRFYSSVMMKMSKSQKIMVGEELVGYNISIKIEKNKVGKPGEVCDIQLRFDSGWSAEADILNLALKAGVITKEKTTYYYGELKLGVGENRAQNFLRETPELIEEIKAKL